MIEKGFNTPMTSSCGRLFDAVAAILGLHTIVAYEGQAAVILESIAEKTASDSLDIGKIEIVPENGRWILNPNEILHNIVKYKIDGKPIASISRAFHNTLIDVFIRLVEILREQKGTDIIALSGGCFQNIRLLTGLYQQLEQRGFHVFTNKEVPVNDGGISLGQAYWGMHNFGQKA
jgi:hydrogenase maturation protein HypF